MKVKIGPYPPHRWYHNWLYEKFDYSPKQKVDVHIDGWDVWSMDHTLAEIVLPMLKRLKADKHGSSMVDDEDVPHLPKQGEASMEGLQLDMFACEEHDDLVWDQYQVRWNWVMDEMIWAFEQKVLDDWEDQYYEYEEDPDAMLGVKIVRSDHEGRQRRQRHQARMTNGFRLFGKYYEGLWD